MPFLSIDLYSSLPREILSLDGKKKRRENIYVYLLNNGKRTNDLMKPLEQH